VKYSIVSRVPYVEKDDLPAKKRHVIESQYVREGENLAILQAIGNNVPLLEARRAYGSALRHDSGLNERYRELIILTVAAELESRYVWHQHVRISLGGILSKTEIRALSDGDNGVFDPADSAGVEYVRQFISMDVDDAVHERLSSFFDDALVVGRHLDPFGPNAVGRREREAWRRRDGGDGVRLQKTPEHPIPGLARAVFLGEIDVAVVDATLDRLRPRLALCATELQAPCEQEVNLAVVQRHERIGRVEACEVVLIRVVRVRVDEVAVDAVLVEVDIESREVTIHTQA
jgi:alkylhydroperoxidase family enzyme